MPGPNSSSTSPTTTTWYSAGFASGNSQRVRSPTGPLHGTVANASSQNFALWGLGGVGKTQIALQIAYWAHHNMPDWAILWIPVMSRESFEQACEEIGDLLDPGTKDAKHVLRNFLRKEKSGHWLLVIDSIISPALY